MKPLLFALALLILPHIAEAQISINLGTGVQTITPTETQIAKIARLRDLENASRAAQTPPLPAITSEQWLRAVLISAVQSYVQQASELDAKDACVNYKAATQTVRNQIDAALKASPCP